MRAHRSHRDKAGSVADDGSTTEPALRTMQAIGTTAIVAVTEPAKVERAARILRDELVAIDAACSRFRADSELSALHRAGGTRVEVTPLLFDAITVACDVARRTDGAVDPTVGSAIEALGYDRDYAELDTLDTFDTELEDAPRPAPGWWRIELDPHKHTVRVPPGVHIDLGSSAKALVADRAARRVAHGVHTGVLVSIGGDIATAGTAPRGGWAVGIAADSSDPVEACDQVVAIESGGMASSNTAVRTWRRGARRLHHIVDPTTGNCASSYWSLVSASGDRCVDANAASTAAVVWGRRAVPKLVELGLPVRLVRHDGHVIVLNGWPPDSGPEFASGQIAERAS
jgi:FAD:protein FMN transferase